MFSRALVMAIALVFACVANTAAFAQNRDLKVVDQPAKQGERRIALVIGNSAYRFTTALPNPKNDATAVADALKKLGFDVDVGIDMTKAAMQDSLRRFGSRLEGAQSAVFYYAGHGFQVKGINYLAAVDTKIASEKDIEFEVIDIGQVLRQMESNPRVNLVFLDACRDNPFAGALGRSMAGPASRSLDIGDGGLAPVDAAAGTLISYATKDGTQASDGVGDHSPYTNAILAEINTPGLEVGLMLRRVRARVMDATQQKQVPWDYGSLLGEFYFAGPPQGGQIVMLPPVGGAARLESAPSRAPVREGNFSVVYLTNQRGLELDADAVFGTTTDRISSGLRSAGFKNLTVGNQTDGKELAAGGEPKGSLAKQRFVFLVTLTAGDNGTHPLNAKIHNYSGTATLRVYDAEQKAFVYNKTTSGNQIHHSPDIGVLVALEKAADTLSRDIVTNAGKIGR